MKWGRRNRKTRNSPRDFQIVSLFWKTARITRSPRRSQETCQELARCHWRSFCAGVRNAGSHFALFVLHSPLHIPYYFNPISKSMEWSASCHEHKRCHAEFVSFSSVHHHDLNTVFVPENSKILNLIAKYIWYRGLRVFYLRAIGWVSNLAVVWSFLTLVSGCLTDF